MPAAAKRKTTAKKGGSTSKKARVDLNEDQYYQGVNHSEFGSGFGCGSYLLGTPHFTFQSPVDGLMRFEVHSGMEGPGTGGFRLCVSCEDAEGTVDSPIFMVPFQHVEQFIMIDEPMPKKSTKSTKQAYRAIIIPTAAVGASALRKTYPKVISFTLPDQKAGTDFKGIFGEAADDPDETYRTLVTRVFNEQLAPFEKSVIDISSAAATKDAGKLFFLETGILFHSETAALYLTAESTPAAFLVSNYEPSSKRPGPVNLTFVCPTSEPYYEKAQESEQSAPKQDKTSEPLFISFHDISLDMSDAISQYAKRHGIKLDEVEQDWYSLKQDQPMTGWMPRGMMSRT
ncbi:hypothetical protein SLS64_013706 [Diaporthe eres]